ncbi:MAG: KEOPS complex subunit Pcc1 [Candidatus Bathyarchaeia archaeon]
MRIEAEITLTCDNEKEAEAISMAVSPDNLVTPKELIIETRIMDSNVITLIEYQGEKIATFISTMDDLLDCISTAERAISVINKSMHF